MPSSATLGLPEVLLLPQSLLRARPPRAALQLAAIIPMIIHDESAGQVLNTTTLYV